MFNINETLSFNELRDQIAARADQQLPDVVVHVSTVTMNLDGHLDVPGMGIVRLNSWSRKQFASDLGFREKWFASVTPDERAEEVNRRLSRMPGQRKFRAFKDRTGQADGVLRAILSPGFTPIDDQRIFDRLGANLGAALDTYRFLNVESSDKTEMYTAVRVDPLSIRGDELRPGFRLRNSEVGAAALSVDDFWLRQICDNGLIVTVGAKRLLYRTHRRIDDDHLAAALVIALSKLPERWAATTTLMERAMTTPVDHPDAAVAAVLEDARVPRALVEAAQVAALFDGERTRYGVVQAVTLVAHRENRDPDLRFLLESRAGHYLTEDAA